MTTVIVDGIRTPIGKFGGSLKNFSAAELGTIVIKQLLKRNFTADQYSKIDEVILGCVGQIGKNAYLARQAAINAGLPIEMPAYTVNRLCSSGLQSIVNADQAIRCGEASLVIAGGAESMSTIPYYNRRVRFGSKMGNVELEDGLLTLLSDPFEGYHMGITAENVAEAFRISREAQDYLALESQQRANSAIENGLFKDEIVPIEVKERGKTRIFDTDEHIRQNVSMEELSSLRPVFKENGTVTAGNSSGINDGAAGVIVADLSLCKELGLKPKMRLVAASAAGVEPHLMGSGPIPAVRKVLKKSGLSLHDIDIIESNEAFAAQALAVSNELEFDPAKVNVNGGAIALGHPVGATGAILTVKIMNEMRRRKSKYGLVTMCIGGGQGLAAIFENYDL